MIFVVPISCENVVREKTGNTKGGSMTVPLTSCLTGLESAIDNFCFHMQNKLIQTSQTGGQWYSDTSPFSFSLNKRTSLLCYSFKEKEKKRFSILTT
jgi:hypothetical protein